MIAQPTSVTVHWPCIGLADKMVSDKRLPDGDGKALPSLRDEVATSDGLCYVCVLRPFHDGTYLARVAASLDLLEREPATIVLTEEHLRYTLPLDTRTEGLCPARLRTLLHSHATAVQPATKCASGQQTQAQPVQTSLDDALLSLSEAIEVTPEALQDTLMMGKKQNTASSQVQQALLCLVVDSLMERLYGCQDQARAILIEGRCKLMTRLQRWQRSTHQRVVNVVSCVNEQQQAMWRLVVGAPSSLVATQTIPLFPYGRVSSY
jgi:hypothetical protein